MSAAPPSEKAQGGASRNEGGRPSARKASSPIWRRESTSGPPTDASPGGPSVASAQARATSSSAMGFERADPSPTSGTTPSRASRTSSPSAEKKPVGLTTAASILLARRWSTTASWAW